MNTKFIVFIIVILIVGCATNPSFEEIKRYEAWRKTEKLVDVLKSNSKQHRVAAIQALGNIKDPRAIGPLSDAMSADSWVEREATAKALGQFKDALALKPLIEALKDEEKFVRDAASQSLLVTVEALSAQKDLRFYRPLIGALKDDDEYVQKVAANSLHSAVMTLKQFNDANLTKPLVKALEDENPIVKETAAQLLGEVSDPNAITSLLDAQKDDDFVVRETASEALENFKDNRATKPLIDALNHENSLVRAEAIKILSDFDDDISIKALIAALSDDKPRIKEGAAKALGEIRDERAIEPLIGLLKDKTAYVQVAAGEALSNLEWVPKTDEQRGIFCVANRDWPKCIQIGALSINALVAALKGDDLDISVDAGETLQTLQWKPENDIDAAYFCVALRQWDNCVSLGKSSLIPVSRELENADTDIVLAAIKTLGDIKDPEAITYLNQKFSKSVPIVREEIVRSLAKIKDSRAISAIIKALDDNNRYVRETAKTVLESEVSGFKQLQDPETIKPLINALKDNNRSVRVIAAKFLGEFQDPEATKYLIEALKDQEIEVKKAASESLRKIKDTKAIEPLVAALKDPSPEVREEIVKTLGEFKDHRAIEPLIGSLNDNDAKVRIAAISVLGSLKEPRAIESLIATMKDYDVDVRLAATKVLGGISDPNAIPPLVASLTDDITSIRVAAGASLKKLQWKPENAQQSGSYCVALRDWETCRELGDKAVPALTHELIQTDSPVKVEVIELLGEIKDPTAIGAIIKSIDDTEWMDNATDKSKIIAVSQKSLKKFGNDAIPELIPTITHWNTSRYTAPILKKLKWTPRTDVEMVRYQVALRSMEIINSNWDLVKRVLLLDIESRDPQLVNNAVFAFMGIGREEIVNDLLLKLNASGSAALAEVYLNSGHKKLMEAAVNWAIENSLPVNQYEEGKHPVSWGEFNDITK